MDKPMSMSVKDYLIRILSVKMMKSENVVEAVVNHQFSSSIEAMKKLSTVEISGFGKMCFNQKKTDKKYEKALSKMALFLDRVNNSSLSEAKRLSARNKLTNTILGLESLKPRVSHELVRNLSGMEEQLVSSSRVEGTY
jgi:nucleoid DNA-binding protein